MIDFRIKGEKFSAECASKVFGVLCRYKRCSAKDICRETGISKMTAGRVLRFFKNEKIVKVYGYKPIFGRGVKPAEYYLHPKTSCAVLDMRQNELNLYLYSIPRLKKKLFSPKIRSDRPLSDKLPILKKDCFSALKESMPEKYLLSLSVLYDRKDTDIDELPPDYIEAALPDDVPRNMFFFSSEEIEEKLIAGKYSEKTVLYLHISESVRNAKIFRNGDTVFTTDLCDICTVSDRFDSIPRIVSELYSSYSPDTVCIFTPFASSYLKSGITEKCRLKGVPENAHIDFPDEDEFDIRKEVVNQTIKMLIAESTPSRQNQEILI